MKTLSFSSLCKRTVALFVLAASLCVSVHAETSPWTTSYFETQRTDASNSDIEMPPCCMAPMRVMGKFENGYIYMGIRTYYDAILPCPVKVTFSYGPTPSVKYGEAQITYIDLTETQTENDRYAYFNGTGGQWARLNPTGIQVQYYSVKYVTVLFEPLDRAWKYYFPSYLLSPDSTLRIAFETCSMVEPGAQLNYDFSLIL